MPKWALAQFRLFAVIAVIPVLNRLTRLFRANAHISAAYLILGLNLEG